MKYLHVRENCITFDSRKGLVNKYCFLIPAGTSTPALLPNLNFTAPANITGTDLSTIHLNCQTPIIKFC